MRLAAPPDRSAAKPSTLTHTKSLIVGGARRHLPAHDRLANVGITAQVLALIEPIHGARGGGPKGKRNGMCKHGRFTAEAVADRATLSALLRQSRATAQAVEEASIDRAGLQPR